MGGLPPWFRPSPFVCHSPSGCMLEKLGGATDPIILPSSGGFQADTPLRNWCRRCGHCEYVCDLVPWHIQGSRSWVGVCELLAY